MLESTEKGSVRNSIRNCLTVFQNDPLLSGAITKKRLRLCKDAISYHTNLTEICILYGFKDYTSFFRAFKKEFGMSPKEFKELSVKT